MSRKPGTPATGCWNTGCISNVCNLKWAYQLANPIMIIKVPGSLEFILKLRGQELREFIKSTKSETGRFHFYVYLNHSRPKTNCSGILPGECSQQADDFKRCAWLRESFPHPSGYIPRTGRDCFTSKQRNASVFSQLGVHIFPTNFGEFENLDEFRDSKIWLPNLTS